MRRYLIPEHEEEIMSAAVIEGDFTLASGRSAHQKFEFDNIQRDGRLLTLATNAVSRCIQNEFDQPDAIVTVANGATCMGDPIVRGIEGRHIRTAYQDSDRGKLFYLLDTVRPNDRVVVIDDVYTSGTNSGKVVDLLIRNGAVPIGVAVLLNRSDEEAPQCRSLPVRYVIQKSLQ